MSQTSYTGAVRYDTIHGDITRAWSVMNHGLPMNGWDASHVADAVCFRLRDLGLNILDIPTHCMGHDPRTQPLPAAPRISPVESIARRNITALLVAINAVENGETDHNRRETNRVRKDLLGLVHREVADAVAAGASVSRLDHCLAKAGWDGQRFEISGATVSILAD